METRYNTRIPARLPQPCPKPAMTPARDPDHLARLVRQLCTMPHETEWVEFKGSNWSPQKVGNNISALANAAALHGKSHAHMVWGIDDQTHAIVGTTFHPGRAKKGNEMLEAWLQRLLSPRMDFRFHECRMEGKHMVVLEIDCASSRPVAFEGTEFIRVAIATKRLAEYPEKERRLWRTFEAMRFEDGIAAERMRGDEVIQKLDYSAYFQLLNRPVPDGHAAILEALQQERLIEPCEAGDFNITNLGAILFARRLDDFRRLERKAVRVIEYRGSNRIETLQELAAPSGYACGFYTLLAQIQAILPSSEKIGLAFRETMTAFPETAVRELVANALIHQDLTVPGTSPMVEIFADRLEITNPGEPLVDTRRFMDTPPKSRNEAIASLLRRCNICEERGSGIDKVVLESERQQLPAPLFEVPSGFTRVTLMSRKNLSDMDKEEQLRTCYWHACRRYHIDRSPMTNASLRDRFGVTKKNSPMISRLLAEAIKQRLVAVKNPTAGTKIRHYAPYWAISDSSAKDSLPQ